jgi:starch synthase (maltosyl-transferring)
MSRGNGPSPDSFKSMTADKTPARRPNSRSAANKPTASDSAATAADSVAVVSGNAPVGSDGAAGPTTTAAVRPKRATPAKRDRPATAAPLTPPPTPPPTTPTIGVERIPIIDVAPVIECGKYPAKAIVGEQVNVAATVFREGHDALGVNVVVSDPAGCDAADLTRMRLVAAGTDRYEAVITPTATGFSSFRIEAWADPLETWRHDAGIKVPEGQDVELMLEEGARLHEQAAGGVPDPQRLLITQVVRALREPGDPMRRLAAAWAPDVLGMLERYPLRTLLTRSASYPLWVDRERALFSSWYEFFPRSEGSSLDPPRSGTFKEAEKRLPAIADMGFDVVYLPPIHPIGTTFRKGANNTLDPGPDDPGVPWAIGSPDGGHDAVHPDLGSMADFDAFVAEAGRVGVEVALDFALQASPDHPWVKEHPAWFTTRADGTIAYAENPPKKYQDIYPLNFDNDYEGLYAEISRVLRLWMSHGVRIFRVDNPHTKPVAFWAQLLADIKATDPDVLFLAEAFTRPAMMRELARVGFHQSYTYFTWRNTRPELEAYLAELSHETSDYLRPNFFVNTPDILHAFLQQGGPPAFRIRAVLAATSSPSWGVYSGYELFENQAVRPGSEEYLDSEKYQYRPRDYAAAEQGGRSLAGYLTRLNKIRRDHVALQRLRNISLHSADNPQVLAFSKRVTNPTIAGADDTVLVIVNLNPFNVSEATLTLDMPALGFDWSDTIDVVDQLSGAQYLWGQHNYVRLDPHVEPAHILAVRRHEP